MDEWGRVCVSQRQSGTQSDKQSSVLHGPALILQTSTRLQYLKPHPTRVLIVAPILLHHLFGMVLYIAVQKKPHIIHCGRF